MKDSSCFYKMYNLWKPYGEKVAKIQALPKVEVTPTLGFPALVCTAKGTTYTEGGSGFLSWIILIWFLLENNNFIILFLAI